MKGTTMIRNIFSAILASILALLPTLAHADDYFAANTHVLVGDENIVSAEYAWQSGNLGGYGFVDKSLDSDFIITDHEVRLDVAGPLYVSAEIGYNKFGGEMGKVGVGVRLGGLPVVRDGFAYLNVYAQQSVFGPDADQIVGASWSTKDIRVTDDVSVYVSGFADFKVGAPDVTQTQVWVKPANSKFEFGTEVATFGGDVSFFVAVKRKF